MKPTFQNHLAQTTPFPFGIKVDRAEGAYIYDQEGKKYLDLISGISVSALGHGHPRIKAALKKQIDRHLHVMVYGEFIQDAQNELAEELLKTLPQSLNDFYFLNSGAEANEAALKLAKRASGRTEIIAYHGAYHGSTHGALSVSSNESRKAAFRPLLPEIRFIELNKTEELSQITEQTAAVILETIQGDAGVRIPKKSYLQALRKRCDATKTLLILDEIQCGMGRSGKFWAFEHFDIVPDILTAGKALGAGMPMGCLVASQNLMKLFSHDPMLGHITTFGGHPLCCAAAAEGLRIMEDEKLPEKVDQKAELIISLLKHPEIKTIRQIGLLIAVELENESKVKKVVLSGLEKGILLFWFLSTPHAFRIAPPYIISEDEIREGCALLIKCLDEL